MTNSQSSNFNSAGSVPPVGPSGVGKASSAKKASSTSAKDAAAAGEANEVEDSLTSIINLAKKDEGEAFGLSENDMTAIISISRHVAKLHASYLKMVPSLEIVLPSGLSGRLIWRKNTGYVFSFDSLSVFNLK